MKIKKAILTGGGRGSRLFPITTNLNKHLLPLANKPMIFHAIERVVEAGVEEIFINTNPGETQLQEVIGDGAHWGIKITFFEQTGGPQGIAHVVNEAKHFIGDDPFIFYLSDNILLGGVKELVQQFEDEQRDCMVALSRVSDPSRFGLPVFDEEGTLIDFVEKPANPQTDAAVTGIYLYGPKLFFEAFNNIEKSARGEYEISDIHSFLLKSGKSVGYREITGWWKDTGKPDDLLLANQLLLDDMGEDTFRTQATLQADTSADGKVSVGHGTTIGPGVTLVGPVMIGENCHIEQATVGPYATIGTGVTIKDGGVRDSIVLDGASLVGVTLKESLIATGVDIAPKEEEYQEMILGEKTRIRL